MMSDMNGIARLGRTGCWTGCGLILLVLAACIAIPVILAVILAAMGGVVN